MLSTELRLILCLLSSAVCVPWVTVWLWLFLVLLSRVKLYMAAIGLVEIYM